MTYSIFEDTMADMTWPEIEAEGKRNTPVLFPLGVIEQHGPHLPLATDIYTAYLLCKKVRACLAARQHACLIAPPCYWGINHCTGAFPGSFSVKPETMEMVLRDIFDNLRQFGFTSVYCVNQHGDPLHTRTILNAVQSANEKQGMRVRLLMEPYDLQPYGLSGGEPYILTDEAEYPPALFAEDDEAERGLYDIHAGAYETAAMAHLFPEALRSETAERLPSCSLSESGLRIWQGGGEAVKSVVPQGYAGNPAGYKKKTAAAKEIFEILADYCAKRIMEDRAEGE